MHHAPIRFITDDVTSFVDRELRRDKRYDGIILDPPKYGRGPKGEFWRIENHLTPLLQKCLQLLSEDALLMVLTIYAIRASSLAAHYALADLFDGMGGSLESGELVLHETPLAHQNPKSAECGPPKRLISQANFARWHSNLAMKQT